MLERGLRVQGFGGGAGDPAGEGVQHGTPSLVTQPSSWCPSGDTTGSPSRP
jgi:hypothetical protein